jgi:transposase InsO family protein
MLTRFVPPFRSEIPPQSEKVAPGFQSSRRLVESAWCARLLRAGRRRRPPHAPLAFARAPRANGLTASIAYYNSLGVTVARVMTDNGSCYKAFAFDRACKRLKLKHIPTKPYTPKTNGKAERFIQTALREWG